MARVCPTTMIFIPCRKGYSHRPEEFSDPAHIAAGARVLAGTLARLSHEPL
jgi:acetylornithine deacetylase/succinyl-diaminopimelate desuccinylase-like protein